MWFRILKWVFNFCDENDIMMMNIREEDEKLTMC